MRGLTQVNDAMQGAAYSGRTMKSRSSHRAQALAHTLPCVIVTGASSGIGLALAGQLADAGCEVIAIGRNQEALQALAARHHRLTPWVADLADVDSLPGLVARIVAAHPRVQGLINNAGMQNACRFDEAGSGPAAIRQEVDVNLVAPLVLAQCLLAHFRTRQGALIVNVTSGLGYVPKRTAAVYSATKAGLHLFTRALRLQLEGSPVRAVEAVMPLVDTPMTAGRGRGKLPPDQAARALLDGLLCGRDEIFIGKARFLPWLHRWAPGLLARAVRNG